MLTSESRRPGMTATRRCAICGEPVAASDGERCTDCAPRLSPAALDAAKTRKEHQAEIAAIDRISAVIRRMEGSLRKWHR
jgi:hypothetical protein